MAYSISQRLSFSLAVLLGLTVAAHATPPAPGPVQHVPNQAYVKTHTMSGMTSFVLDTYAGDNDAGGGEFYLRTTGCTGDNGVTLNPSLADGVTPDTTKCFIRKFVGPVDLRWYGVADSTTGACIASRSSCDATAAFNLAQTATLTWGNGIITTGGRSIVLAYAADVTIQGLNQNSTPKNFSGITLDCEAPTTGASRQTGGADTSTPYYKQNSALIINPAYSLILGQSANLNNCRIFPTWYVAEPTSVRDVVNMSHQFTGTAVRFGGSDVTTEAASADNLFIVGFDTCTDMRATSRATYSNILTNCNNQSYLHNQRGSVYLDHWSSKGYLFLRASGGGQRFDVAKYPITGVANAAGEIEITVSTAQRPMEIIVGDKVFATDIGETTGVKTTGAMVTGQFTITNIPAVDGVQINPTFSVQDLGSGACFAANTTVSSIAYDSGTDTYTATMNNANLCTTITDEEIFFRGVNYGPAGANYLWVVRSVTNVDPTHDKLVMANSSWTGPTLTYSIDGTGANWRINTSAVTVFDMTNIIVSPGGYGPYLCASGTAPFCTPPTGFTFSTSTLTDAMPNDALPITSLAVGDTTNWPCYNMPRMCQGVAKVGTEYFAYNWIDQTHIAVPTRGWDNTSVAGHSGGATITAAAPQAVATVQATKAVYGTVLFNAKATASASNQTVSFLNDVSGVSLSGGYLILNPSYRDTTALVAAGPPIGGIVNVTATGPSGAATAVVSGNYWKIFRGMNVRDITNPARIPSGTVVTNDPTSTTITFSNNIAVANLGGDVIQFYGCGYPSASTYYLGNCVATSHIVGGGAPEDLTSQGVNLTNIHTFGTRVAVHLLDAKGTAYSQLGLANGGGSGAQQDIESVAFWGDGDTDTWRWVGGWATAYNTIVNTPAGGSNHGGTMTNIVLATKGGVLIQNVGSTAQLQTANVTSATPGVIYQHYLANQLTLTGDVMQQTGLYYDRVSALNFVVCASTTLLTVCQEAPAAHGNYPVGVASMSDFTTGNFNNIQYVNVAGYYGIGTGGGGDFTAITNGSATVDGGIYVADSQGNLFRRNTDTGDVRQWGAYCDVQKFTNLGVSTLGAPNVISTGSYQAPQSAVGATIIFPVSGGTTFYPQDGPAIAAAGTGYVVGDTLTVVGGTGSAAVFRVTSVNGSGGVTGTIIISVANYGAYTVLPSNPVSTTTGGGGSGATLTLKWIGNALYSATITAVGTNTITFDGAGITVAQDKIPAFAFGRDDHLAIAAASTYESTTGQQAVYFPALCGTTVALELPARGTTTFPQIVNPRWIGAGVGQSSITALASMTTVVHRAISSSRNGGLANMTIDGMGLATDWVVHLEGGRDFTFNNVNILNGKGSGNAGYFGGSLTPGEGPSNTVYNIGRVWTETWLQGVNLPDYQVRDEGESPTWNMVSMIGATIAYVHAPNGGVRFNEIHVFPGGSGPTATYGVSSGGANILVNSQIDQAITADLYIFGNDGSYIGNTLKCGNSVDTRATYGIQITTGATRVAAITGNAYDQTCDWPSATRIHLDGVLNGGSAILGNTGASVVQFPMAQGMVAQGRLTLSSTLPVMAADVASGSTIYYLPYTGQGLPIFTNLDAVATGEGQVLSYANLTSSGLSLALDNNAGHTNYQAIGGVYDIFAYNSNTATTKLCTYAWTSTTVRSVALAREANSGLWVNASTLTDCRFGSGSGNLDTIGTNAGVYLGSAYMVADGRTIMTFVPAAAAGGGNARLGLYNAYNKVPFSARSLDSTAQWTYGTATWRSADNNAANRVTWLDGLADIAATMATDIYVKNSTSTDCRVGVDIDSTSATPTFFAVEEAATGSTIHAPVVAVPALGLHYGQAVEFAASGNCLFSNGSGFQRLDWQGAF